MRISILSLIAISMFGAYQPAHAWGEEGHRVTGRLAELMLTPVARHELRAIMRGEQLADTATWMDRKRDALAARTPTAPSWHYENRGICTGGSNAGSCGEGNCATRKITEYRAVLASADATDVQKREAVRFIVHLVGDIHQPLHIGDDGDRGGNDVSIVPSGGVPMKLHAFWDTYLVQAAMHRRPEWIFVKHLRRHFKSEMQGWMSGGEEDWAVESFELAKTFAYPKLEPAACGTPLLGRTFQVDARGEYVSGGADVVARRMAMAGARIAFVLNSALDPQ